MSDRPPRWARLGFVVLSVSAAANAQRSPLIYDGTPIGQEFDVSYSRRCAREPAVTSRETVPAESFSLGMDKLKCDWGQIGPAQISSHAFNKPVSAKLDKEGRYALPLVPTGDRNIAQGKVAARLDTAFAPTHFLYLSAFAQPAVVEPEEKCPKQGLANEFKSIPKPNGLGDVLEARGECELSAFLIDGARLLSDVDLVGFETRQSNTLAFSLTPSDSRGTYQGWGYGGEHIQVRIVHSTRHKFVARPRLEPIPGWDGPVKITRLSNAPATREQFYIQNSGGSTMSWRAEAATASGGPWLRIVEPEPAAGTLEPYGVGGKKPETTLVYVVDPAGVEPGNYTGTITVTADGAIDSPRKMEIAWTVLPGVDDSIRVVSQTPPATQPLQAGLETDVKVVTSYNLQTKESGEIVVDVSAAGATTRTTRAAVTRGAGTKELTVEKFAVPAGATSVNANVSLVSGTTRLASTSTSFPTRAAQDAVQIAAGSVQPDPLKPLAAGEETAIQARVQYVLQTQADARLVLGVYDNAQGGTAIAASPPAPVGRTDPANSSKQLAVPKFVVPKEATELYLRAALLDSSDATISESAAVKFTVEPPPEITISSIEAVQAVQVAAPGEVPLILGRPAVVRAFVQQKGRPGKLVAGITGTLQVTAGSATCTASPRGSVTAHLAIDRGDATHSLNFPVPSSCLGSGGSPVAVRYEVRLELEPGNKDTVEFKDNPKEYRTTLQPTAGPDNPLRVRYLKVCLGSDTNCPYSGFGGEAGQYVELLLPFQPQGFQLSPGSTPSVLYPQELADDDATRRAVKLSAFRMWLRRQYRDLEEAAVDVPDMLVALVPITENLPTGESDPVHGGSGGKGRVAFVMDYPASLPRRSYYFAHELGHNLGLRHTNTDDGCSSKAADPNTNWIYRNGTINGVGWDHQTHTAIPSTRFDLMTYCTPTSQIWVSPFDFNQVYQQLQSWRTAKSFIALPKNSIPTRQAAAAEYLFIAGSARRDGSAGALQRGYTLTSTLPGDESDPRGTHCLVFAGAGGELARHCFSLSFDNFETGVQLEENFFELKLPLPSGATRLDLTASGRTLANMPISASPPTVNFVSPQAGEKWSGQRTVSWTASDPAGGKLGYKLSYSSDDGVTWQPLAFDIETPRFALDTGRLNGGTRVWFRVQASGGVRTGEARVGPIEIAADPVLETGRETIAFGTLAPGAAREEALELRATGSGAVKVTALRLAGEDFQVVSAPLPFTVPAGGVARVAVRFAPRQSGFASSQLEIETDSASRPVVIVALEGGGAEAQQPLLALSDDNVDFGSLNLGATLTLPLELRNAGTGPLGEVKLSATPAAFTVAPAAVASLAAGAAATVNVKFTPTVAGLVTGTLTVGELSVPLRGVGTLAPQPAIDLSLRSLDFGEVALSQRKELSLAVRNRGTAPLQVTAIAVNNALFSFRPATLSVPAGAERELTVAFAPTQAGAQTATLRLASNDRVNPEVTVALRGAGVAAVVPPPPAEARIEVTPTSLEFGSLSVGATKDLALTLRNAGAATLNVTGLTISDARFSAVPAAPFTIAPGATGTVTVRFAPSAAGAQTATLTIRSNAANQPSLVVPLTGTGASTAPPPGAQDLELKLDDGTFEQNVGYAAAAAAADVLFVNRLPALPYPVKLKRVRIYLPDTGDGVQPGSTVGVVVGLIAPDAELTPTSVRPAKQVLVLRLGQWLEVDVPEQTVPAGTDIVVGYSASQEARQTPAALDTSGPSQSRSYGSANSGRMEPISRFTGFDGNLAIRAVVTTGN